MTKLVKYGLLGVALFVGYKLFVKGSVAGSLFFNINRVAYSLTANGILITLFIDVKNPKQESLLFNRVEGRLKFNGQEVGVFKNDLQIMIDANKTTQLPLPILLGYGGLTNALFSFINSTAKNPATFTIEGNATVEDFTFPFITNYQFV